MLDEAGNTDTHTHTHTETETETDTDTETDWVLQLAYCRLEPGLLPKAQALSQPHALGFFQHEGAQGNV